MESIRETYPYCEYFNKELLCFLAILESILNFVSFYKNLISSHANIITIPDHHTTGLWMHKRFKKFTWEMFNGLCLIIDCNVHHIDY